ncbi:Glycosyltransferase involved in cell wall bisynthesis [Bradyrhizobium canariense]|uniref:Glycosyltransferase involved in cell wall bisynthesis n=1 Tax=Bradyrhizobium canariense TaxID=255045 RepID=A0A1H1M2T4_9BRAD|nr:Glycosyltransferase involved in cell wall bisynthesis [Bradyrhizobium canariense]
MIALAGTDNGGTYQYTLSMLQALRHTSGFDITLYGDPQNRDFIELGYPIRPFIESRARQMTALAARNLHIGLSDPFVSEDVLLAPIYSLALLHTSKPFAFTLHDLQENYYPENFSRWTRFWRHQVYTRLLARTRRVICESSYVKKDIMRFFGMAEERTVVITAPPLRQFMADESSETLQATRRRLQLPDKFLFYPAQFWVHKNHSRLLEAFREVVAEVPDLKLVLTGKKRDEYEAVMAAVAKFGLSEKVCHLGYVAQEDLQAIYRLATALVMPSLFESVSIPIYEAFQVGTPVAASGILAIPEQVGDAGLLFDPMSVNSIRDAMLKIVKYPDTARLLGQRGREKMLAMTPERYGAQLQNLLLELR